MNVDLETTIYLFPNKSHKPLTFEMSSQSFRDLKIRIGLRMNQVLEEPFCSYDILSILQRKTFFSDTFGITIINSELVVKGDEDRRLNFSAVFTGNNFDFDTPCIEVTLFNSVASTVVYGSIFAREEEEEEEKH